MKKSNKLTAAVTASMVASTLVVPAAFASATEFTDISNSYAKDAIMELVEAGILNGTGEGKFNPAGKISRQDFAIILAKTLNLDTESVPAVPTFSDVPVTHYSYKYVEAAVAAELIAGTGDGQFGLGQNLTREAMAVLFVRATGADVTGYGDKLDFSDADKISAWAKDAVAYAVEMGLMNGAGNNAFNPQGLAERQQVALVASNFLKAVKPVEAGKMVSATLTDDTTITIGFDKEIDALTAEDVTVAVKATGAAVAVESVSLSEDMKSATVKVAKLAAGTTFEVSYKEATQEVTTEAVALAVDSAEALNGVLVAVTLTEAVKSVDASAFAIADANGVALEVKGAVLSTNGKTVYLTTATQSVASLYTLKAAGAEFKFVGLATDATKPEVNSAFASKNNKVKVQFTEDVNETALIGTNYTIEGLTVSAAEYDVDGAGNTVKSTVVLTTSAQTQGTIYKVVVKDVTDFANNALDTDKDEFQFGGVPADVTKPKLDSAFAPTNTSVKVSFNEELDKAVAENVANYAIEGLSVLTAELQANKKDVVLTTAPQTQGTIYKVVVTNVTDESGNVLNSDNDEFQFGGVPADAIKPQLTSAFAVTNTVVRVNFNETLDKETAENATNYTIDGLTIVKAELETGNASVKLTTSAQTQGTVYKVAVANVKDASGNVLNSDNDEFQFGGVATDSTKPYVQAATSTNANTIEVTFSEEVDAKTATKGYNYYLGSELGYATKAEIKTGDPKTVVLTTATQKSNVYTVDVTGVTDLSGNATDEDRDTATFGGTDGTAGDTVKPKVVSAVAVDKNTLVVSFNEEIDATTVAATDFTFTVNSGTETGTAVAGKTATAVKVLDDNKTVKLQFANLTANMTPGVVYKVTATTVLDKAGNDVDATYNNALFAGTSVENVAPKVTSATLLNNQTLSLTFSEPVKADGFVAGDLTIAGFTGTFVSHELSADAKTMTVYYSGANPTDSFAPGALYDVVVGGANITDELAVDGLATANDVNKLKFAGVSYGATAPKVSAVVAVDVNTLDIQFDQKVTSTLSHLTAGDIQVLDQNGAAVAVTDVLVRTEGTAGNKIRVFLNTALTAGQVYKVTVDNTKVTNGNGQAMLAANNTGTFAAVATANVAPKLVSATALTNTTVRVTFSEKVTNAVLANFAVNNGVTVSAVDVVGTDGKTFDLTVAGVNAKAIYEVSATTAILDEAGVGTADATVKATFVGK